ncbi:E3 SUMO-protein ligase ZBED1-like [Sceloporus undulatus]|uniref:E3 SUMO-protein ligase ZBED1-like n=1 Tax=Sceloporus undulatus TaxID=8520 RepID=UPI001C4B4AAB|nr:E3 SUMO-protein ligase ZBED1-like [Sceloporus undulatus]XP_042329281.1 E3 SUMO-protein ligase ZBED1-like [Sceloporus undulatus]XP_042329282.1 E3 SUMO-protein ligase ZBED1-like [Sceloporus undulatus]
MQVAEDACTHLEDELLFCEDCRFYFRDSCPQHGPPTFVADSTVPESTPSRALLSLPEGLVVKERPQGGFGVWSTLPALPRGCIFGPYEGEVVREHGNCTRYSWAVRKNDSYFFIDASDDSRSSWMRYVACASTEDEQNLTVFQYRGYIYYRVCQTIPVDTELLVWIGEEYARTLGLHLGEHFKYEFGEKELLMKLFHDLLLKTPSSPPAPHAPSSRTQYLCGDATASALLPLHKPGLPPPEGSTFPLLEGTQNLVGLGRAQSRYWTFFGFQGDAYGRILDKSKIICKLCGVRLSYSGNTTNLRQHLIYKHRCEYNQLVGTQTTTLDRGGMGMGEFGPSRPPAPGRTTQAVAGFIVLDLMPVEVVEGEGFGQMLGVLDPSYKPPDAASLAHTVLKDMYTHVKGKVWELVRALPQCSLSLDVWCHSSSLTYLTLTVHYVDNCFEPRTCVLSSRPIPEEPSAESLAEALAEASKEWGLRDSTSYTVGGLRGADTQKAAAALGWTAVPCIGQALRAAMEAVLSQPAVQRALERLHRLASWVLAGAGRSEKLRTQEPLLQAHLSRFLQDGGKWHSVYAVLQGLLEHSETLAGLGPDEEATLHPQDWAALQDTVKVLKPMSVATSTFTKEPFSSLSLVKPVLTSLLYKHLVSSEWDSTLALDAKAAAQKELNQQFSNSDVNQALNLVCALDPRFRGLDFLSHVDRVETLHLLKTEASRLAETSSALTSALPDTTSSSPPAKLPKQDTGIEFLLGDLCSVHSASGVSSAHQQAEQETASFQTSKASALGQEPLQWWKMHHTQYPVLAQAARKLLGVPATSVPAGWLFSNAGDTICSKRRALTPEHVDMLVFLHGNRAMLY